MWCRAKVCMEWACDVSSIRIRKRGVKLRWSCIGLLISKLKD